MVKISNNISCKYRWKLGGIEMDVNNVMSTYNLNSVWNSLNPNNSTSSAVPLIDSLGSNQTQSTGSNLDSIV